MRELKQERRIDMTKDLIEQAKSKIDEFIMTEYEQSDGADFSDLSKIEIAFTTTDDELHNIQAYIDLINPAIIKTIDNIVIERENYKSLEELISDIPYLEFSELTYVDDEQLAPFYK